MDETVDRSMAGNPIEVPQPRLPFSEDEEKVLALYDRLQELRLEIAIINAQKSHPPDATSGAMAEETQQAQNELLETRAKYTLRNDVTEAVMMACPIVKAVHGGTDASSVESDLLPYVEQRDDAAIALAKETTEAGKLRDELTKVQADTIQVSRENIATTAELLSLVDQVKQKKSGAGVDPKLRQQEEKLAAELRSSKQRWRLVKGVVSGVIAGSGVDWARNDELRDIVLDPDTDN